MTGQNKPNLAGSERADALLELSSAELDVVVGGFNPQPDPPARIAQKYVDPSSLSILGWAATK